MPRKPWSLMNCQTSGGRSFSSWVIFQSSHHAAQLFDRAVEERLLLRRSASASAWRAACSSPGLPLNSSPSHHTVPASSASCSVCDTCGRRLAEPAEQRIADQRAAQLRDQQHARRSDEHGPQHAAPHRRQPRPAMRRSGRPHPRRPTPSATRGSRPAPRRGATKPTIQIRNVIGMLLMSLLSAGAHSGRLASRRRARVRARRRSGRR